MSANFIASADAFLVEENIDSWLNWTWRLMLTLSTIELS
jgi:hypothetical protein